MLPRRGRGCGQAGRRRGGPGRAGGAGRWVGPSGGGGAGGGPGAGAAMALNLSKNGRALQEAYGRVVAAGSPTDW